jgi:hypothetical protein
MDAINEISGIEPFLLEGEGYFRVVQKSHLRPRIFTPEIVHSVLCMALEKFIMAILMRTGNLPDNHTFADLVFALKTEIPVSAEIEAALLTLDLESDLCSLEIRKVRIPGPERMQELVAVGARLQEAAREAVRGENRFPLNLE